MASVKKHTGASIHRLHEISSSDQRDGMDRRAVRRQSQWSWTCIGLHCSFNELKSLYSKSLDISHNSKTEREGGQSRRSTTTHVVVPHFCRRGQTINGSEWYARYSAKSTFSFHCISDVSHGKKKHRICKRHVKPSMWHKHLCLP